MVLLGAAAERASVEEVLADAGVPAGLDGDPETRVPIEVALRIWSSAAGRTGDHDFGLHLAELADRLWPPPVPVRDPVVTVRHVACTGGTVRDLLDRLERFWSVVNDAADVTVETIDGRLAICHRARPGCLDRQMAEMTIASWFFWCRRATGKEGRPMAVWFGHDRPSVIDSHTRVFAGAPLRFSAGCDALVIAPEVAKLPLRSERLPFGMDPAPEEILWRVPRNGFLSRARAAIAAGLPDRATSAAGVASRMRMSPRTYYRRLAEYRTSHHRVLDSLRHEYAVRWLADPHVTVEEVAWRLGFAEPSAFHRAFRRWTGLTPMEFRRHHTHLSTRASGRSSPCADT